MEVIVPLCDMIPLGDTKGLYGDLNSTNRYNRIIRVI